MKTVLGLLLLATDLGAQQTIGAFADSLFRANFAAADPGAAVVVFDRDRVLHRGTYGVADLATGRAIAASTPFYLASVSKPFTALAIRSLIASGKLRNDDRLVKLVPELRAADSTITVEHLLTHSSGLVDFYSLIDWPRFRYIDNAGVLDSTRAHPRSKFTPGSKYEYSNTGYVLLSVIAERVSGKSLSAVLSEAVFMPLGMNAVLYSDTARQVRDRAIGYYRANDKWLLSDLATLGLPDGRMIRYHFVQTGQGGVFASIDDLAKWGRAMLGHSLIDRRARDTLWQVRLPTPQQPGIDSVQGVAHGWFVSQHGGQRIVWHDGNRGGAKAIMALAPERGVGIAILSNREDTDAVKLASALLDMLLR